MLIRDVEVAAILSLRIGELWVMLRECVLLLEESSEIGDYGFLLCVRSHSVCRADGKLIIDE